MLPLFRTAAHDSTHPLPVVPRANLVRGCSLASSRAAYLKSFLPLSFALHSAPIWREVLPGFCARDGVLTGACMFLFRTPGRLLIGPINYFSYRQRATRRAKSYGEGVLLS